MPNTTCPGCGSALTMELGRELTPDDTMYRFQARELFYSNADGSMHRCDYDAILKHLDRQRVAVPQPAKNQLAPPARSQEPQGGGVTLEYDRE